MSASIDLEDLVLGYGDNGISATAAAGLYVNGSRKGFTNLSFDTITGGDEIELGVWLDAYDRINYSPQNKQITVPGETPFTTETISLLSVWNNGWNACRAAILDSDSTGTYYTGTKTTKYDAPAVGATGRDVLYPYHSHTIHFYDIPDAK